MIRFLDRTWFLPLSFVFLSGRLLSWCEVLQHHLLLVVKNHHPRPAAEVLCGCILRVSAGILWSIIRDFFSVLLVWNGKYFILICFLRK